MRSLAEIIVVKELVILDKPHQLCWTSYLAVEKSICGISRHCTGIRRGALCWPMLHASGGYDRRNIPTSQEKIYGFVCSTNITTQEEGETFQ